MLHYYLIRAKASEIDADSGFENFNILAWWKLHESTYFVPSIMTCDLLTPHASIVDSKSVFSTVGRMLTDTRNHM